MKPSCTKGNPMYEAPTLYAALSPQAEKLFPKFELVISKSQDGNNLNVVRRLTSMILTLDIFKKFILI